MKTARLALIAVILTAGSLFAIAQLSPLMFQRDIDQLTDVPVAGRIEQSRALLKQPLEFEQAKKVLDQVKAAAYHHDDPQELVDFFVEVGESDESAALRAAAFRNAASTLRERFRNDDALVFYKRALELQPTRNNEEWIKKLDLAYQIAQDDWYSGRWQDALFAYITFSSDYSHIDHHLNVYAYFEAMPTIALALKEEGEDALLKQVLSEGLASVDPGELFGYAMMALYLGEPERSRQYAEAAKTLANNRKFDILYALYEMAADLSIYDIEVYEQHFNAIAANPENDNYLSRFTATSSWMFLKFFNEDWNLTKDVFEVFMQSPLHTDIERRQGLKRYIYAFIRLNHAISLTYHDGRPQAEASWRELCYQYPETDAGQQACLILVEDAIKVPDLAKAQRILDSLPPERELDFDVWPRANIVRARLLKAQGKHAEARQVLDQTIDLPERKGLPEIKDSKDIANRLKLGLN